MKLEHESEFITNPSERSISLKKAIFFSGLFLWVIQEYIMRTKYLDFFGYTPCTFLRIISLILLVLKILYLDTTYSVRLFCFFVVSFIIAIISQLSSNAESSNTMLNVLIICMAARDIDFAQICSFNFWVSGSAWVFTVLSAFLGIIDNGFIRELWRIRYYLGFDYVSFPSIYLINIIFSGFYAYTKRKKRSVPWAWIVSAALINQWVYEKTVTRLAYAIIMLFLVFYISTEKLKINILKNNKIVNLIATLIFPIGGILTFIFSIMYTGSDMRWRALNEILNNRLLMNKMGMDKFGLTLFGQRIISNTDLQNGEYFFIDSGYMSLLLRNGVVLYILVLIIYTFLLRNSVKTDNTVLSIWLICVCVYCIANGILLSPVTNCSLLAAWQIREEVKEVSMKSLKRIKSSG